MLSRYDDCDGDDNYTQRLKHTVYFFSETAAAEILNSHPFLPLPHQSHLSFNLTIRTLVLHDTYLSPRFKFKLETYQGGAPMEVQ